MILRILNIHFSPTDLSKQNLLKENKKGKIIVSGNTSLDNLLDYKKRISYSDIILITLHRRENLSLIDNWFLEIDKLAKKYKDLKFILSIHKNLEIKKHKKILSNLDVIENLPHKNFINIFVKSKFIITDRRNSKKKQHF